MKAQTGDKNDLTAKEIWMRDPATIMIDDRTGAERVAVIYMREQASTRVEGVIDSVLVQFSDDFDKRLVLDAIERRLTVIRTRMGL